MHYLCDTPYHYCMKRLLFLSMAVVMTINTFSADARQKIEEIERLDRMVSEKGRYDDLKYQRLDSLTRLSGRSGLPVSEKIDIYTRLGDEYTLFKADSAMAFYSRGLKLAKESGDSVRKISIYLKKIRPEMIAGFHAEANSDFFEINTHTIPENMLPDYYECGYRIYSFALSSIEKNSSYYDYYYNTTNEYRRKWIASMPEGSVRRRLYEAEQALWDGKLPLAQMIARELLSELPENRNEYAIAAAIMANIMRINGNDDECIRYFAMSAISDIQGSVKENQSMYELAMMLYDRGDIDRAYRYIFSSIEDAAFCNAQLRVYNASRMLPVIEASHREELKKHETVLLIYIMVVSILFLGLAVAVLLLMKQMKKLSRARMKLKEANTTKDEYMGQFIELCSVYMRRLDSFTKLVNRKLTSGQIDDLIKTTKSIKFNEEQHREFYQAFDLAFLKIYTTFIDDVNALLRPEERIVVDTPGSLNTELRIYALYRLGIVDNSKIAEFLKYSVNTIYTYRNKMKNKAIDRANFEDSIMKIGAIE